LKKIVVTGDDWNGARAKLKSTLEAQNASFNRQMQAVFAPKSQVGAADQQAPTPAEKREQFLSRSRQRG
jgi:hypothetical protein